MPTTCCVVNCGSRGNRDLVNFYKIPSELHFTHREDLNELSKRRRQKWIHAIRRKDLTEVKLKYSRVCSKHFLSAKPSELNDENSPDWVPFLAMGYGNDEVVRKKGHINSVREERARKRRKYMIEDISEKYSPRTPILSDDLEISEPSQGKPFASKGGYQYEMLKKSSNNFITWVCVKRETEQCHGRLTSKFGFVMKEFPHSCREDTVINLMEHCANIKTEISKGNGDIPRELISGNASPEKEYNLVKQEQSSSEIEMDSFTSVKQDIGVNVKNKLKRQRTEISSKHSLSHPVEFDPSLRRLSEDVLSPEPEKSSAHSENVICRLCLESSNRNEATPLSLPDKNCSEETSGSKKIRAMQTAMFANMLQILMPHFDLGMACNPVMCPKCKTLLLSAYNFVETCTNNENVIYLYKSKYASDGKKVFCEDVVKSLPALLNEDDSPNKKLKMMELESDITESREQILSNTIQDCTEIEPTCPSPVKQENIENVEKYSSPSTESLAIVEEKIIAEDFSDDFIDISVSEHISSVLKMRSLQKKQSSPDNCGTIKVDKPPKNSTKTHFCDKSFQVTNISAPSYNIVEPTKKSDYDIDLT